MNNRDSVKTKAEAVEKRYVKTLKGNGKKVKPKLKIRPIIKKDTIGIRGKVTF